MENINWEQVVIAIQEKRFNDVPACAWVEILKNIMPAKKGRPPRRYMDEKGNWTLEHLSHDKEFVRTSERDKDVCNEYDELILAGQKPTLAKQSVATKLSVGEKTVEKILSERNDRILEIRQYEKESLEVA